jgi:C4-dicarboxylate transporter DctM subunit
VLLIFLVVIGGIYGGFFTPTEAAAIGTVATGIRRLAFGRFAWTKRGFHAVHVRHGSRPPA